METGGEGRWSRRRAALATGDLRSRALLAGCPSWIEETSWSVGGVTATERSPPPPRVQAPWETAIVGGGQCRSGSGKMRTSTVVGGKGSPWATMAHGEGGGPPQLVVGRTAAAIVGGGEDSTVAVGGEGAPPPGAGSREPSAQDRPLRTSGRVRLRCRQSERRRLRGR